MAHQIEGTNLTKKELILSLIKADLRSVKLVQGLEKAGALVEYFHSDLSITILKLIGFEQSERTDELYTFYDTTIDKLVDCDVDAFVAQLNYLAVDFYNELLEVRMEQVKKQRA